MSLSIEAVVADVQRMREEICKAVIGQDEAVEMVLVAMLASGHVLLEGAPGLGKTLLVRALAKTFSGAHARIQFTPDLMPSDVIGHVMYNLEKGTFNIRRGPIFTSLLLADEINRAPAKTQAALLEAMQEQQVTLEGKSLPLPQPFMTLATQNPLEQEGTYPLPEAQLDRFLFKLKIDYPAENMEVALVDKVISGRVGDTFELDQVTPFLDAERIVAMRQAMTQVAIDESVTAYAVRLARATREWRGVAVGAGPRGPLALLRAARAYALLAGRDFVFPDDVKAVALPALRHRLLLTPDLEIEGRSTDHVLRDVIEHVEAPRL